MSATDEGRVHHERRWTLDWWMTERRLMKAAYDELVGCFAELTTEDLELPHFETVWWEGQAKVDACKRQIKRLEVWRKNLAPHDPCCYLATVQ